MSGIVSVNGKAVAEVLSYERSAAFLFADTSTIDLNWRKRKLLLRDEQLRLECFYDQYNEDGQSDLDVGATVNVTFFDDSVSYSGIVIEHTVELEYSEIVRSNLVIQALEVGGIEFDVVDPTLTQTLTSTYEGTILIFPVLTRYKAAITVADQIDRTAPVKASASTQEAT